MSESGHLATEKAWRTWKKACAAGRCDTESEAMLRRFGSARFATYLNRYAATCGHFGKTMSASEVTHGWHLLETHACVGTTRAGKRYKDWLFARADAAPDWLSAVESGASLLMRDVVREWLRRELSPAFMTSMQLPVYPDGGPRLSLEDLLPDPSIPEDFLGDREERGIARMCAEALFPELDLRDRITVWARARGIPLYDRRLLAWTTCSQSLLYKTYREVLGRLAGRIAKQLAGEPPAIKTRVAIHALAELDGLISEKISVEKEAAQFFKDV